MNKDLLLKNYDEMLKLLVEIQKNNSFYNFEDNLSFEDSTVAIFKTLYKSISNCRDIKYNPDILNTIFKFQPYLKKERLITLTHKALSQEINIKQLNSEILNKIISLKDKDIYIVLARDPNIDDTIAQKIFSPIYLVMKNILENKSLTKNLKNEGKEFILKSLNNVFDNSEKDKLFALT